MRCQDRNPPSRGPAHRPPRGRGRRGCRTRHARSRPTRILREEPPDAGAALAVRQSADSSGSACFGAENVRKSCEKSFSQAVRAVSRADLGAKGLSDATAMRRRGLANKGETDDLAKPDDVPDGTGGPARRRGAAGGRPRPADVGADRRQCRHGRCARRRCGTSRTRTARSTSPTFPTPRWCRRSPRRSPAARFPTSWAWT